jgi:hypothetical protein
MLLPNNGLWCPFDIPETYQTDDIVKIKLESQAINCFVKQDQDQAHNI